MATPGEVGGPAFRDRLTGVRRGPAAARTRGPGGGNLPTKEVVANRGQRLIPRTVGLPPYGTRNGGEDGGVLPWTCSRLGCARATGQEASTNALRR